MLVADDTGALRGFLGATIGFARRTRHNASLVVGVRQESWGRGIGRSLLAEAERWARARGVTRLELSVTQVESLG